MMGETFAFFANLSLPVAQDAIFYRKPQTALGILANRANEWFLVIFLRTTVVSIRRRLAWIKKFRRYEATYGLPLTFQIIKRNTL